MSKTDNIYSKPLEQVAQVFPDMIKPPVKIPCDNICNIKMRNIWFLPSASAPKLWIEKCIFEDVRIADINDTLTREQRAAQHG